MLDTRRSYPSRSDLRDARAAPLGLSGRVRGETVDVENVGGVEHACLLGDFSEAVRVADAPTSEFRYGVGAELGMMDLSPEARSAR